MPIEAILTSLDGQAGAEIARIESEATERVERILSEARSAKQAEIDRFVADRVARQRIESERLLNAAHTADRRASADVRRGVFEEVFALASERLEHLRQDPRYPEILTRLIDEASDGIREGCRVHVDPRDLGLVAKKYCDAEVIGDLTTLGGAVVFSADGRVKRSNTVEDRLARVHDEMVREVSEVLYR